MGHARKIVCLGDPVVDVLARTDPSSLEKSGIDPGGCLPISKNDLEALLQRVNLLEPVERIGGGSAANVAKGIGNLEEGSGHVAFAGRCGNDQAGRDYEAQLKNEGVHPLTCRADDEDTATCLCLVTPDGQRTMRTSLGAAAGLKGVEQMPQGWLEGAGLVHMEGYVMYRPELAKGAIRAAQSQGALVSLDLASFELIHNCSSVLEELLSTEALEIVFCNEEEAAALAEVFMPSHSGDFSQAAQAFLLKYCQVSVVSLGAKGCLVRRRGEPSHRCSSPAAEVRDTIGAGDYFTAGFLHSYLGGCTVQRCGEVGCLVGSASVQCHGAQLGPQVWKQIRAAIKEGKGSALATPLDENRNSSNQNSA